MCTSVLKYLKQKGILKICLFLLASLYFEMTYAECLTTETVGSCQRLEMAAEGSNFNQILEPFMPNSENKNLEAQLLVFVSNSMPEQSLKQWSVQTEKAGGTLILRGFIEDSPLKTIEWVKTLFFDRETSGFSIDPERFEEMDIHQVPAVVVVPAGESLCLKEDCPKPSFGVVYGDVPIQASLSVLARQNPGPIAETALGFLERYQGEK